MIMKKIIASFLGLLLSAGAAFGQATVPAGGVMGNSTATERTARAESVTAILDRALGSTRGSIITRGASGWTILPPGTSGRLLTSSGAGADPTYTDIYSATHTWTALQTFNGVGGITVLGASFYGNSTACSLFAGFGAGANIVPSACGAHSGDGNTFFGYAAGASATTTFASVYVGTNAGNATVGGDSNTCLGYAACQSGTSAKWNVAVGTDALFTNVLGQDNSYFGHHVGTSNVFAAGTGQATVIGAEAGKSGVGAVGMTLLGYRAGFNVNASAVGTTMAGYLAGFTNTSGSQNSYFGQEAGFTGLSGSTNAAFGYRAGYNNSTGSGNVFLGPFAGFYETNSNRLYIDSNDRGSLGAAPTAALVYGVFSTTVANQTIAFNAAAGIRNNTSTCFTGGPNGTTNPVITVDCSTASQAAGVKITGAATAGTVAIVATDSGAAASLQLNAKGIGTVHIGDVSTGGVVIGAGGGTNKISGLTVTASTGTLTITNGKTLSISNTITQTATDGSTVAFGAGGTVSYLIATGTKALATSAISSATCTSAQTDTATNATTSSVVDASFASDPTGVTGYTPSASGMLTIIAYATANTVNFKVCNNTASSITPGAISLNWRVRS